MWWNRECQPSSSFSLGDGLKTDVGRKRRGNSSDKEYPVAYTWIRLRSTRLRLEPTSFEAGLSREVFCFHVGCGMWHGQGVCKSQFEGGRGGAGLTFRHSPIWLASGFFWHVFLLAIFPPQVRDKKRALNVLWGATPHTKRGFGGPKKHLGSFTFKRFFHGVQRWILILY